MLGDVRVTDFDFELPSGSIADRPAEPRDAARLLVHDRDSRATQHAVFAELSCHLRPGDLLVLNDTQVRPWRLLGRRPGGGRFECLILRLSGNLGEGFVKPAKKLRPGVAVPLEDGAIELVPRRALGGGRWEFELRAQGDLAAAVEACGRAPLPPYIPRDGSEDRRRDRERYQTVYAAVPGAVAAPTAGLHFTAAVLQSLAAIGVETARVTLHVGEGTFAPLRVDVVEQHRMHAEDYELPDATAAAVARTRARGGRVVAVGTTSCRTLETCAAPDRLVTAQRGSSELFMYPGRQFQVVDALLTNFHLPQSTLLMLVCAFAGHQETLALYRDAIARGYRFYSFGDAMLLL